MNRIFELMLVSVAALFFTGCYNDLETPAQAKVWTDKDFATSEILYIREVKDMFYTMYPGRAGVGKSMPITEDYVIRGKVISSDRTGNIYKSLYIYDDQPGQESAIELRLTSGNYLAHPVGQIVYVKLKGLVIGNYRGMLSVGVATTGDYANDNIESKIMLDEHIFSGHQEPMLASDTLRVTPSNYQTVLSDNDLGRLVRFENIDSKYGKAGWGYQNTFPNYFANQNSYDVTSPGWENIPEWATWATTRTANGVKTFYFGSAWFTYGNVNAIQGNYVVRSSAYSTFWDQKMPADGAKVDLTAIYTLYTDTKADGTLDAYQVLLMFPSDVVRK